MSYLLECKFDIDAAYQRCNLSSSTAFESLRMFDDFLFVALCMTFGGAPNLSLWGVISETTTDVGKTLLQNEHWCHTVLFDPISNSLESPLSLPDSVPFKSARELSVQLPANDSGRIDIFIDDSIGIAPAIDDIPTRVVQAIPLAIRTLARPASDQDVVPPKDIISIKKLQAEGWLEETKTILGWVTNTRSGLIFLPDHKLHAWVQDIDAMLSSQKCSFKSLEALLGRLNHVACIFLPMRHFLGRLYRVLCRIKDKLGWTKLFSTELED